MLRELPALKSRGEDQTVRKRRIVIEPGVHRDVSERSEGSSVPLRRHSNPRLANGLVFKHC